jgi:hypothetical protein
MGNEFLGHLNLTPGEQDHAARSVGLRAVKEMRLYLLCAQKLLFVAKLQDLFVSRLELHCLPPTVFDSDPSRTLTAHTVTL